MNAMSENISRTNWKILLPALLVFGFLWTILINHLRVEWTLNPEYGYGWAVPFLCLFLAWQRIPHKPVYSTILHHPPPYSTISHLLFLLLALLYAPTRLVQEANPEWRLVSWALALEVVGLTWLAIYFVLGVRWLKLLAFPVGYFLVAVPWPTVIEAPLIQGLTRMDAKATVELLGWFGVPALPHGNVIEVATGEVGIEEACSGIRSFQATLMISLFLGELFQLKVTRRLGLILGGFALAILFNLARMFLLVNVAAHQGVVAIAKWHDPTGITILLACFFGLLGLGLWLKRGIPKPEFRTPDSEAKSPALHLSPLIFIFCLWIVACEILVECWYRSHEARLPAAQEWTMTWPTNNPTFKEVPLSDRARQILRYDESHSVAWQEDGVGWQAVFLRWDPGRTALHLAQNHTPAVCLTAAGHALTTISELEWVEVGGLRLPFAVYEVTDAPQPVFVFYCLWDDRASQQGFATMSLTYGNRLAPVMQGLRDPGQRSLEMAVTGLTDANAAETAAHDELEKLVTVIKP
jgi:exosortase